MKKHLVLVLSMMLVLGFAASAFAIHAKLPGDTTAVFAPRGTEIRLGGEVRVRGWYGDNITNSAGTVKMITGFPYKGGSMSWYDQRVRLFLDVKTAPNVTGRVLLETAGENWTWGAVNSAVTGNPTFAGGGVGMNIHEAWIAYTGEGLLGVTSGIRAGRMPIVIGEGTFFDHRRRGNDAILLFVEPAKGTEIVLATAKVFEGGITTVPCRDLDTGAITARTACIVGREVAVGPPTTIGGITDNTDDIDLYSLMFTHKLDKDNTVGLNYAYVVRPDDGDAVVLNDRDDALRLQNLGIFAKGKAAGLGYKATGDIQFGSTGKGTVTSPTTGKSKFGGYAFTAGVNYKVDPVTLRANFVYGSGNKLAAPGAAWDAKNEAFQTLVGNVVTDPNLPTVVYGWRVVTAARDVVPGPPLGTGISNTTAYNLGLTFSPIKDMTAHLDYYLLRASEQLSRTANEIGYSKEIGSELDLRLSYRLARGLTYSINSGILFAGDFYKVGATGPTSEPKNAVVFQHGLVLSF